MSKLNDIRTGLIDLRYLFTPKDKLIVENFDMEIYNDDATRYSCLLFHNFGINSLYLLYNGIVGCIDIEAHPEEKHNNSFYFYKVACVETTKRINTIDNYSETIVENKKVWTSCYIGDFLDYLDDTENISCRYSYISNEDFKYFIKSTLIDIFSCRIKSNNLCIDRIRDTIFSCKWKKNNEKIAMDFTSKLHYLINKQDVFYNRNEKTYVLDANTDKENEMSLYKKLTDEQVCEYNNFKREQCKDIESLKEENNYYESELLKLREISLSSRLMKSIIEKCQHLFEYDEKLIEHYKTNIYAADKHKIMQ
jgi:hypothetical protein